MCGIFGIYDHPEAANIVYLGLQALQHRGQESAGIVSSDKNQLYSYNNMGLVTNVFNKSSINNLKGTMAIGHVRYSTAGESNRSNAQPFMVDYSNGQFSLAHNGNLVNFRELREELEGNGALFFSSVDGEVIVHLFANSKLNILDRVINIMDRIKGAYSLLFMTENEMIAIRDPHGFRPLSIGKLSNSWIFSSETSAFDLIGAKLIRSIKPGEIVVVNKDGVEFHSNKSITPKFCIFEHVYFARPDSQLGPFSVYESRYKLGQILAKEHFVPADIIISVPDSGTTSALGYSEESKIPFGMGLVRNHYIGRTFIEPEKSTRGLKVRLKLSPVYSLIKNKRVVVVDDSLVRGTTSKKIVSMLRDVGAKEVHLRISSPPVKFPCYYGIDIPSKNELIANSKLKEEIKIYIEADSLEYISLNGMKSGIDENRMNCYCDACFSGNYPVLPKFK